MKQLFELLLNVLENGQPAVLATVVASSGSAPGGLGASMLVDKTGRRIGTVGGGAVEYQAEKLAARVLAEGRAITQEYTLQHGTAGDIGMVCGGAVTVYFCPIAASEDSIRFAKQAIACFAVNEDAWLLLEPTPEGDFLGLYSEVSGLLTSTGKQNHLTALRQEELAELLCSAPVWEELAGHRFYGEPLVRAGRVVVFGGGHVAQALVPVLGPLGFYTVVYDDRPEFACRALFPTANELIVADFSRVDEQIALTPRDWLVIVTRGHAADYEIQRQVLGRPFAYVGVIGSHTKTKAINQRLLAAGIAQEAINTVHTPIGLAIGAETPAEIAISIAAEMVQIRAGIR